MPGATMKSVLVVWCRVNSYALSAYSVPLFRKQRDFSRPPAQIPAGKIPSMSISNCASAKLDEPRLVGMKGDPEACEP